MCLPLLQSLPPHAFTLTWYRTSPNLLLKPSLVPPPLQVKLNALKASIQAMPQVTLDGSTLKALIAGGAINKSAAVRVC